MHVPGKAKHTSGHPLRNLCLEIAKDINAFIFFRRDCTFNVVTLILTLDNNLNPNIRLSESCSLDQFVVRATTDNTDTVFAHS